ncbi:glycosyltransferase involved in cell wall biosynthesis [Paraburkholderia sp. BL18I3N2]|uniref:glycosyltransferase family 4 protein n=1 Tax=Paraburkholderia sp. BL18I3N2 TaxID=1938799 RepID=UPI000D079123|nr:glycosyltransferase family 4 protein [Paraburkholderia sp. BL18I3N2]PRX36240.1 glycosyltransferase involved in cell wall biosynthesis [Paraburkholderia sp. BL18I3N2]
MSIRVLQVGPGRGQKGGIASVLSQLAKRRDQLEQAGVCVSFFETHGFQNLSGLLAFFLVDMPSFVRATIRVDVVHFHVSERGSFYRKFALFVAARLFGKRTVFQLHSGNFERFVQHADWVTRLLAGLFLGKADCVIAVSTPIAKWLQHWRRTDAVQVVGNMALDAEHGEPTATPLAYSRPYIAFTGRLSEAKGLDELIQAVADLVRRGRDIEVRVAGTGDMLRWQRIAAAHGVDERVVFEGWLDGNAKLAFYRGARLFCMPSHFESFGIATLEAMFCGLPVVGTRLGGFIDLVEDGVSGYLVDVHDSRGLAEAICRLVDDPEHAMRMGSAGLNRAQTCFRAESIIDRYVDCYRRVDARGRSER